MKILSTNQSFQRGRIHVDCHKIPIYVQHRSIDAVLFATVVIQNQRKRVFNDMQEQLMKYTMSAVSTDASQIHLVFNRYMENSIKSQKITKEIW